MNQPQPRDHQEARSEVAQPGPPELRGGGVADSDDDLDDLGRDGVLGQVRQALDVHVGVDSDIIATGAEAHERANGEDRSERDRRHEEDRRET